MFESLKIKKLKPVRSEIDITFKSLSLFRRQQKNSDSTEKGIDYVVQGIIGAALALCALLVFRKIKASSWGIVLMGDDVFREDTIRDESVYSKIG